MKYRLLRKTYDHTTPCGEYDDLTALVNAAVHVTQLRPDAPVFEVEITESSLADIRLMRRCLYCGTANPGEIRYCALCRRYMGP